MKILLALIGVSLLVALGFLAAFFWAVRSGQYEDEYTPSMRMLFDDEPVEKGLGGLADAPSKPPKPAKPHKPTSTCPK